MMASDLSPSERDVEYLVETEKPYPHWWNLRHLGKSFIELPDNMLWNCFICFIVLAAVLWDTINIKLPISNLIFNIIYAAHALAIAYNAYKDRKNDPFYYRKIICFIIDIFTYTHYIIPIEAYRFICYYIRLHRPIGYLWNLSNNNLTESVCGTTLKYCYIFTVLRITWAIIWLIIDAFERVHVLNHRRALREIETKESLGNYSPTLFLSALYIVNKMFIPIGPSVIPENDVERITCLMVMITGCLIVTGAAVASLSLVISLYFRPEESFRSRYRLINTEMKESHIPPRLREKVQTFYSMYWRKQKAVSTTQLLSTFPPTLPATIYADIYFEATQKTHILKDLTYEFLTELAKKMETKRYIPGDPIIKRSSKKSSIIYITYGDIEMVTAEDDSTAILRMTRGTILTPWGGCAPAGFGRAHIEVRAATFCTAHVLNAADLWRVAVKYGRSTDQAAIILDTFFMHMERVKRHYRNKIPEIVEHKSSILHLKRCLMALKEAKDADGNLLLFRTDVFLEIAGCYIMRNRPDASLTDESDAICLRPTFPCILQPSSSLQFAWNFFVACLIVTVCFVHPYYLVYKKTVPMEFRFFDYAATAIYVLDLIVHLSTGANVEEGVPITFAQTSSQQMRSHWFVLDVLGTLPIFEFIDTGHFAGINKLLRLHKVFRVLKEIEDTCVYRGNVLRFLSYTLLLFIACYLIAALQQGFMCFQFGYCLVTNFTHSPYWEEKPLDEETVEHRLTFTLYWAISMIMFTTHMETWGTSNWNNVLYTMFVLELCIVLRIFMEAVYSATIMVTTALREDYDSTISMVKSCFIRNNVDPVLRQRFIRYLQLCWFTDKAHYITNRQSIFHDLPAHVFQDIVAKQRSKYLLRIPHMKNLRKEDLKNISTLGRLFFTSPNEIILNTGDFSNEIYVVVQGICEVISPVTKQVVSYLTERSHVGVFVCLMRIPSFYTIRAVTHVQMYCVSRKNLKSFIDNPQMKDAIDFIKEQPNFQALYERQETFLSYVPPPPTPNTEQFKLPRKHEKDFAFLQPFYRLGFLSILRYIFPRFTIRPDGQYLIRYEWFRVTCALASAMVFPSYAYLTLYWPWLYYLTLFLDLTAYFDVLQRMLVGYFNEEGVLIYHPASTAAHYIKGPFIVDVFGCLPWENLEGPQKIADDRYIVTHMKQFLMFGRLFQLYRLQSAMLVLREHIERGDLLNIIKAIPLFLVLLNIQTSLIVLYSAKIYYTNDNQWFIVPKEDEGGSWIDLFGDKFRFNMTSSLWNLHLGCYFWVVYETTTTGYNIFSPSNFQLMRVLFIGMLTGAMLIVYFSVRIISIRANVNKALAEFQAHMRDMVFYMRREKLDKNLQKTVFDYYEYNWDKNAGVDYRNVFKMCDQITLRTDAILNFFGPTFAKCPIFSYCDVSLLRIVGRAVRSSHFLRDMTIIKASDVIKDMYFIDYGSVQLQDMDEDASTITLTKGSVFGNLDGDSTIRCPLTFTASTKVHLLMINSKVFYHIIKDFPQVEDLIVKSRGDKKTNYIKGSSGDNLSSRSELSSSRSVPRMIRSRRRFIKYVYFKDNWLQIYLMIVSLVCIHVDVYNAGFQDNRFKMIVALYLLDIAFYLKIFLFTFRPYIGDDQVARDVVIPKRKRYLRGEFKFDVISCLPIEVLCVLNKNNTWMIFSWLRLNRMFRIVTVYKCLKRQREKVTKNLVLTTVWSVFAWFSVSVHSVSCLWYFIGVMEDHHEPGTSWIHKDDGSSWCDNTYICSLYFVITTFTQNGVGDIIPKKQSEVIFVCILQMLSTMVYLVYVGEFSNIIQYKSFRSFSFYSKYLELQEFLKNNRVSRNLVEQVNRYCVHLWREARGLPAPHFLTTAPRALKLTIMSAAYLRHIEKHYVFEECEPAFLRQLVGCFQIYTYNENMPVVNAGEITDSMYFIHRGKVIGISKTDNQVPKVYLEGSSFGIIQGLKRDIPFKHTYKTTVKSLVLTLRLDDWLYLLNHFPASKAVIDRYQGSDDNTDSTDKSSGSSQSPKRFKSKVTELMDQGTQSTLNQGSKFILPPGPSGTRRNEEGLDDTRWPLSSKTSLKIQHQNSSEDMHENDIKKTKTTSFETFGLASTDCLKVQKQKEPSKASFLKRVASTVKHFLSKSELSHKSETQIELKKTASKTSKKLQDKQQTEDDYIEWLEKDYMDRTLGRLSQTSTLSDEDDADQTMAVNKTDSKAKTKEEKVDEATSAAQLKRKAVRIKYDEPGTSEIPSDNADINKKDEEEASTSKEKKET